MIAYDKDVDFSGRKNQPTFYGYLPDDNGMRGRCFALMTLISALHNVSRSIGCALLATCDKRLVAVFVGGELTLYIIYKLLRGDYFWFVKLDGALAIVVSFLERFLLKMITDYTGCLHMRHPYELGGLAFCISMVWAQAFPFVALQFYEEGDTISKDAITAIIVGSFSL